MSDILNLAGDGYFAHLLWLFGLKWSKIDSLNFYDENHRKINCIHVGNAAVLSYNVYLVNLSMIQAQKCDNFGYMGWNGAKMTHFDHETQLLSSFKLKIATILW